MKTVGMMILVMMTGATAVSAQETPELPDNVKTWMARDQLQRWAQMIQLGDSLFNTRSCMRCHGEGGTAGRFAPDLTDGEWVQNDGSLEGIRRTIFWGVEREEFADPTRRFEMHPSGGQHLEQGEWEALAAYVWSLSNGTFLPGG